VSTKTKKSKKPKPFKKANNFVYRILRFILRPILKRKYRFKFDKDTSKDITRPCFILSNHQTGFDQFAVGIGFKFGINFVASDTIFKMGIGSWFMRKLGRPIPFSKGTSDPIAVKNMMQVIADGGAVGIFPEGNRCFFGETMRIQPGTARLAKKLNVPLVLVQLRGAYMTKPRFKVKKNKGKCSGHVVRVVTPDEMKAMTNEELEEIIKASLYVNEFDYNAEKRIEFKGEAKAENIEAILFYCPACGGSDCLASEVHDLWCTKCNARVTVDEYGFFVNDGVNQKILPPTILEWSSKQIEFVKSYDFSQHADTPVFSDDNVTLGVSIRAQTDVDVVTGSMALYSDRLEICDKIFYLKDVAALSMQEVRKMSIYTATETYSLEVPLKTNITKYMICGYHIKNLAEGKPEYYGY